MFHQNKRREIASSSAQSGISGGDSAVEPFGAQDIQNIESVFYVLVNVSVLCKRRGRDGGIHVFNMNRWRFRVECGWYIPVLRYCALDSNASLWRGDGLQGLSIINAIRILSSAVLFSGKEEGRETMYVQQDLPYCIFLPWLRLCSA